MTSEQAITCNGFGFVQTAIFVIMSAARAGITSNVKCVSSFDSAAAHLATRGTLQLLQ